MPKVIPKIVPHQSKISTQDIRDTSTPSGSALVNEEFRRIALSVNELADKFDNLGSNTDTGGGKGKNLSGNPPTDDPADKSKLEVLHGTRLIVPDTKKLQFFNSSSIQWIISQDVTNIARIIAHVRSSPISTYNNTIEVVPTTRILDFVDGTGTTATVTDGGNGYATIQIDAVIPPATPLDIYDEGVSAATDVSVVDFYAGAGLSVAVTESPSGHANVTYANTIPAYVLDIKDTGSSAATAVNVIDFIPGTGMNVTVTESPSGEANVTYDCTLTGLPLGDEHQTLRKDGVGINTNWIANSRIYNRGDVAVSGVGTLGAVEITWITADANSTLYVGSDDVANDQTAILAESQTDNTSGGTVVATNVQGTSLRGTNASTTADDGNAALHITNTATGSTTTAARIINSGTGRGLHSTSTGGIAGYFNTSGNGTAIYAVTTGGTTTNSTAVIGISTATIGNGAYFQGQGLGIGVEVVQNSASGTGVQIASTGANATALLINGSNASGNRAIYSEGNVHFADHIGTVIFEFNEAYGSIGVATLARNDKIITNGGYYAGPGINKLVKLSFSYTSTTVDSGVIIPDGAIINRCIVIVDGAFDGTTPTIAVSVQGSVVTPVATTGQSDLTAVGQYNINQMTEVSPPYNGVLRATITTSGATTGSGVVYIFYTDSPEY